MSVGQSADSPFAHISRNSNNAAGSRNIQYVAQHQTIHNTSTAPSKFDHCNGHLFLTDSAIHRDKVILKNGQRTTGTCNWITRSAKYRAWTGGPPSLLWIWGGPGKGKTMLSIFLTQTLLQAEDTTLLFYFCSAEYETRKGAAAVLRSRLWQLLIHDRELAEVMSPYFIPADHAKDVLQSPQTLFNMFVLVIAGTRHARITRLVDALDECDHESQSWLADKFRDLNTAFGTSRLWLIIISRKITEFGTVPQINLDAHAREVSSDVKSFIAIKVTELAKNLQLDLQQCQQIEATLLDRSGDTFLWAGFAVAELVRQKTLTQVMDTLQALPAGLDAVYARMLNNIDQRYSERAAHVLQWVCLAARPLTLQKLSLTFEDSGVARHSTIASVKDIVAICGSILLITNGLNFIDVQDHEASAVRDSADYWSQTVVMLVHESARSFLLTRSVGDDGISELLHFTAETGHASYRSPGATHYRPTL
ncbi:hypothetical protein LTR95_002945 [Oleoguttula sp. CCFEE 5521]